MTKSKSQTKPKPVAKGRKAQPTRARAPLPEPMKTAAPKAITTPSPSPHRRPTYAEAVTVYERALAAFQRHEYASALELLQSILVRFPDERELHERVRLYLTMCQKQTAAPRPSPTSVEELLFAATVALNEGRHDAAIGFLRLVRDEDPNNDHALYMLAVAHTQREEFGEALSHLQRAIALNAENRARAKHDPDLDLLRHDESFAAL